MSRSIQRVKNSPVCPRDSTFGMTSSMIEYKARGNTYRAISYVAKLFQPRIVDFVGMTDLSPSFRFEQYAEPTHETSQSDT